MRIALDDELRAYYETTRGKGHKFSHGELHPTVPNAVIYRCKLCNAYIVRTPRNVTSYKARTTCYSRFRPRITDDVIDELEELIYGTEPSNVQSVSDEG